MILDESTRALSGDDLDRIHSLLRRHRRRRQDRPDDQPQPRRLVFIGVDLIDFLGGPTSSLCHSQALGSSDHVLPSGPKLGDPRAGVRDYN